MFRAYPERDSNAQPHRSERCASAVGPSGRGRWVAASHHPPAMSAQVHRRPGRDLRFGPDGHACLGRSPVTLALVAAAAGGHGRILVVEDDPTKAQVLEFLLHEHQYEVVIAADGDAALALLARQSLPDLVLLDVMLPGKDGFDILRHIRATPQLSELPVIMVTAQVSDEHVMRGLKEGADGYVFKPFKWDTLYGCIRNVL